MLISSKVVAAAHILLLAGSASAESITGGVYTNFCAGALGSSTLGAYSGTCSSAGSTFSVSADAEGAGLIWGDQISATDSKVDSNAYGNYAYAYTQYVDLVTLSTAADVTLTFNVQGTTTNINGDYADYYILAGLYQNSEEVYGFAPVYPSNGTGTGSGTVSLMLEEGFPAAAGVYALQIQTFARVCFYGCLSNDVGAKSGESVSDAANFLDTFQLASVNTTNGATLIGADGTNFTALSSTPEPNSLWLVATAILALIAVKLRRMDNFWVHSTDRRGSKGTA